MSAFLIGVVSSLPGCGLAMWFGYRWGRADTVRGVPNLLDQLRLTMPDPTL